MNEGQQSLLDFMRQESGKLTSQTLTHIGLTFISLLIAILIGLPLGILIARKRQLSSTVLGIAGVFQTIPSIALLGFLIPVLGIGAKPAIFALLIYALLPIIRNTYTGITGVNASVVEAARAMGMSYDQILFKVELPLATPVILAGIRTATVINVGVATLASLIAAGGLGEFIFGGISLNNTNMILAGAIPAALLAILFDFGLSKVQNINVKKLRTATKVIPGLLLLLACLYFIPTAYAGKLTAGFTPEFMGRRDGDLGLRDKYGLKIHTVVISDAVMYKAAYEKHLDVISGYSTDGRLKAFNLVVLKDDKNIFPLYYAAPIVSAEALKKFPQLASTLDLLAGKIDDTTMTNLNYRVDYLHQSPEKVAMDFLADNGLYKQPRNGNAGTVRIGSKIFGEQYILASMYAILIKGYTDYDVSTKTGLGGTQICFSALTNNQIDLYPEYTGTGLLVMLQVKPKVLDSLVLDKQKVYDYVKQQFKTKYNIEWLKPIGFNNTYDLTVINNELSRSL
jgi:osmoprotectant transport system permease protein